MPENETPYRPPLTEYVPYLLEMKTILSQRSFGKRYTLKTVVAFCIESGYHNLTGKRITGTKRQSFREIDF